MVVEQRPPVKVAIAVIGEGGRFLVARRREGDSLAGYWEFPGGRPQRGEDFETCVVREVGEELGIIVQVEKKWGVIRYQYPDRRVTLHVFRCRHVAGDPKALECAEWRWVVGEELLTLKFPPANERLIQVLAGEAADVGVGRESLPSPHPLPHRERGSRSGEGGSGREGCPRAKAAAPKG